MELNKGQRYRSVMRDVVKMTYIDNAEYEIIRKYSDEGYSPVEIVEILKNLRSAVEDVTFI
jgi:hypothetical protein